MKFEELIQQDLERLGLTFKETKLETISNLMTSSRFPATYAYDELRTLKKIDSRGEASEYLSSICETEENKREALISLAFSYSLRFSKEDLFDSLMNLSDEEVNVEMKNLRKFMDYAKSFNIL